MYGSMTPSWRFPGATAPATAVLAPTPPPRPIGSRGMSTIGRRGLVSSRADASSTSHSRRAASRSAAMTANGLSSRCLRARKAAAAAPWLASTARWYPPSPFTASTPPSLSSAAALASGSPSSALPSGWRRLSRGPQAGQHTGWAWNRRSAGSWYSAAHRAHMAKAAIVVAARS